MRLLITTIVYFHRGSTQCRMHVRSACRSATGCVAPSASDRIFVRSNETLRLEVLQRDPAARELWGALETAHGARAGEFIVIAAMLTDVLGNGSECAVDVRERDFEDSDHPAWGFRAGQSGTRVR